MSGRGSRLGNFLVLVFVAVLFGGIGVAMVWGARAQVAEARESESWPTTDAVIVASDLEVGEGEDGPTYEAAVRYRYTVEGAEHQAGRIAFGEPNVGDEGAARSRVERYAVGSTHDVSYDPSDPGKAVLEPGEEGASGILVIVGYGLVGLGVVLVIAAVRTLIRG